MDILSSPAGRCCERLLRPSAGLNSRSTARVLWRLTAGALGGTGRSLLGRISPEPGHELECTGTRTRRPPLHGPIAGRPPGVVRMFYGRARLYGCLSHWALAGTLGVRVLILRVGASSELDVDKTSSGGHGTLDAWKSRRKATEELFYIETSFRRCLYK